MNDERIIKARKPSWCWSCRQDIVPGQEIVKRTRSWQHASCTPDEFTLAQAAGTCQACPATEGVREVKARTPGAAMYEKLMLCPPCLTRLREAGAECGWLDEVELGLQCLICGGLIVTLTRVRKVYCDTCRPIKNARDALIREQVHARLRDES